MNDHERLKICQLVIKKTEGVLTSEEAAFLYEQLDTNQESLDIYVDLAIMYSTLSKTGDIHIAKPSEEIVNDQLNINRLLDELSQYEKEAIPLFIEEVDDVKQELIQHVEYPHTSHRISKTTVLSFALSAAAILFLVLFVRFAPVNSNGVLPVATLTRSVNAYWMDATGSIADGCDLYAGPLHLAKGYAEIYTDNGSQVILQAPVQLELESASQMKLHRGQVTVKIKAGDNNYVVRTPSATVVDLGTEFGVYVNDRNNTLTYVYDGQVELRSGSDPMRPGRVMTLSKNQSGHADASGELSAVKDNVANVFVRSEEFGVKLAASKGTSYQRWLAHSYQIRRDPDLVLYYPFLQSDASLDYISNYACNTENEFKGMLGGTSGSSNFTPPSHVTGRWPNKAALQFDRGQRNCLLVEESDELAFADDITIGVWVCCPDDQKGGHLIARRLGERIDYQFGCFSKEDPYYANLLQFLRTDKKYARTVYSSKEYEWTSEWTFLAVTYDSEMAHFYVNGELFESIPFASKNKSVSSELFIGDIPMTDEMRFGYAAFNGLIDEIVIFKRVLSSEEIKIMYQAGMP